MRLWLGEGPTHPRCASITIVLTPTGVVVVPRFLLIVMLLLIGGGSGAVESNTTTSAVAVILSPPSVRVRVTALEYIDNDDDAAADDRNGFESVLVMLELHKEAQLVVTSLAVAVGATAIAASSSSCDSTVGAAAVNVNLSQWTPELQQRRRLLNFQLLLPLPPPLLPSDAAVRQIRTRPLCLKVNGASWRQTGWIFFPPFQETSKSSNTSSSSGNISTTSSSSSNSDSDVDSETAAAASDKAHNVSIPRANNVFAAAADRTTPTGGGDSIQGMAIIFLS